MKQNLLCFACGADTGFVWAGLCQPHMKNFNHLTARRYADDRPLNAREIFINEIDAELDAAFNDSKNQSWDASKPA